MVELLKAELLDDKDFLLSLIQPLVQEVLESEMDETVGLGRASGLRAPWAIAAAITGGS